MLHEIVVGNIGTVYAGESPTEAQDLYQLYIRYSKAHVGRAAGEDVDWLQDGAIYKEYMGSGDQEEEEEGEEA